MSTTIKFGFQGVVRPLVGATTTLTMLLASVQSGWAQAPAPAPAPAPQLQPAPPPQPPVYPQAAPPQQAPQGTYQQAPQGTYQQAPQGAYQQPPQGAYQQPPQGAPQGYAPGQPTYPPLPPPQVAWHPPPKPSKGLMIAGISVFGASYLIALSIGATLLDGDDYDYDYDSDCRHCEDVAPYLFIPLVGPFIAMTQTPNDGGLMMLGMTQFVGAGLLIGGIIRYKNTKRAAEAPRVGQFDLRGGRQLTLDVSSSSRMVGPRATLRF